MENYLTLFSEYKWRKYILNSENLKSNRLLEYLTLDVAGSYVRSDLTVIICS